VCSCNSQAIQGGAVQLAAGNITATATNFTNNTAQVGGAVTAYAKTLFRCTRCSLLANLADDGSGGAIASVQATVVLNKSVVVGNQAVGWGSTVDFLGLQPAGVGGGLFGIESTFALYASVFDDNVGNVNGGAIALVDGKLAVVVSSFRKNSAGNVGGAMLLVDTICKGYKRHQIHSAKVINNTAAFGGGLASAGPTCAMSPSWGLKLLLKNTSFTNNMASEQGGALYASGAASLAVQASKFTNNLAALTGGALMCDFCGQINISSSSFTGNQAQSGGAILAVGLQEQSLISSSIILGNTALLEAPRMVKISRIVGSSNSGSSSGGPKLQGTTANVSSSSSSPLSRWPRCGDPGVAGGICISPSQGGIKLAAVTIARNNAALGGEYKYTMTLFGSLKYHADEQVKLFRRSSLSLSISRFRVPS
jgi:predicted outer membrane repeat protein